MNPLAFLCFNLENLLFKTFSLLYNYFFWYCTSGNTISALNLNINSKQIYNYETP